MENEYRKPSEQEDSAIQKLIKNVMISRTIVMFCLMCLLLLIPVSFILSAILPKESENVVEETRPEDIEVDRAAVIEELYGNREEYAAEKTGGDENYMVKKAKKGKNNKKKKKLVFDEKLKQKAYEGYLAEYDAQIDSAKVDERIREIQETKQVFLQIAAEKNKISFFASKLFIMTLLFAILTGLILYFQFRQYKRYAQRSYCVSEIHYLNTKHNFPKSFRFDHKCENDNGEVCMADTGLIEYLFIRDADRYFFIQYADENSGTVKKGPFHFFGMKAGMEKTQEQLDQEEEEEWNKLHSGSNSHRSYDSRSK